MAVRIDHGQFPLSRARFIWPGSVMSRNPLEAPGARLVAELARTGWTAPGFDIEVFASGRGSDIVRKVSSVSFMTPDGLLRLSYGNDEHNGAYGLSGASFNGKDGVWFYSDGSGSGRMPKAVASVIARIEEAVALLEGLESAAGHDDVTKEGDPAMRRLCQVAPVAVPAGFPVLYAWVEAEDAYRLAGYGDRPEAAENDFGLSGSGWRLVPLGTGDGGPSDPKHFNGYTYAATNPSVRGSQVSFPAKTECLPVEIRLRYLNEVYVVDNAAYSRAREADLEKARQEGRDRMTGREIDSWALATARTLVAWDQYDGSYEEPVVLIGRQTFADEVRLMRGPVRVDMEGEGVATIMVDDVTGLEMPLYRPGRKQVPHCRAAERTARAAANILQVECRVAEEVTDVLEKHPEPSLETLLKR